MAKISTYPIISSPTFNDLLIGTDVLNLNETKNFTIGDIADLIIVGSYVPYTGATANVDLGLFGITASSFIHPGGTSSQFLKADGSIDSTSYQVAGNYLTGLSGEATATGPGIANVVLDNASVIGKVLTGLTISGGTISATDTILTAFGKVQNQINSIASGLSYQGTWDASTNTPSLSSGVGVNGHYYVVGVAGTTNLDGISDWHVGDWVIFNGSTWQKIDNTDTVVSVNGQVGIVVLTTTDISEGTNLYYTDVRARGAISLTTTGDSGVSTYSNVTGILNIPNYSISGLGGVPSSRQLTINGTQYDLSLDRSWSVGTVTSVGTSGPITGGTITGSGTIGITQAGVGSDGYLSSVDWNTFNNKQNALTNPVTGTGTVYYIPMWTGAHSLGDSIISYSSNVVNFNFDSASGATVNYTNANGVDYTYTIQMNNTGTRETYHTYTDGNIVQTINNNNVSKNLSTGQLVLPYYTSSTSFSATAAGTLAFDINGNIITTAPSVSSNLYTADGILAGDRYINGNNKNLWINDINTLRVTTGTAGTNEVALFESVEPHINIKVAAGALTNGASVFLSPSAGYYGAIHNRTGGGLQFYTGPTPTPHLSLTASGRLLLGTTTEGTYLLDVNGTARVSNILKMTNYINLTTSNRFISIDATVIIGKLNGETTTILSNGQTTDRAISIKQGTGTSQVGIGLVNETFTSSAVFEINATTRGFLPPRMTTSQKTSIASPVAGLQVYDTTLNQMSYYNGSTWVNF